MLPSDGGTRAAQRPPHPSPLDTPITWKVILGSDPGQFVRPLVDKAVGSSVGSSLDFGKLCRLEPRRWEVLPAGRRSIDVSIY